MKKVFKDKSLVTVFSNLNYDYEDMYQLMKDTARGVQEVSNKEANEVIREMMFSVLELDPADANNIKKYNRAFKRNGTRFYEVIADVVEDALIEGWSEDPFFMQFVETKNLSDGDKNLFITEQEVTLAVAKVSNGQHEVMLQKLGEKESYSVPTERFGVAVGTDIRLYLTGRVDFTKLINALYKAFDKQLKDLVYQEVMNIGTKLPANSMFNIAIALDAANKETFDQLISDVSSANDNSEVVLMGTDVALKKVGKLTDIDWVSNNMKDKMHETGRLGFYEGTALVSIPQRLARKGGTLERMIANDQILVLPATMDKFIKHVIVGDADIVEVNEIGERNDDMKTFEYQMTMGIGTQVGKYFGNVKITA